MRKLKPTLPPVIDATGIKAQRSDPDAAWGYVANGGLIYGYKVHVIADYNAELPVELRVTPANVRTKNISARVLELFGVKQ